MKQKLSAETLNLWHLRLAHISEGGLKELVKQSHITGVQEFKLRQCEACILGKHKKASYKTSSAKSTRVLEYVHADLWGPSRIETLGGARFFLSIIDDYSRKVWLYVLKTKDETLVKFREWCAEVENHTGQKVKCLRTDNGLEFVSSQFNLFCTSKGIRSHRTVPGHPQQNGVVERMNRTILERVRYLLASSGLPKKFWGEVADTAVYLINRSPSVAKNFKVPQELWEGKKLDISHLRIFGCRAYAHSIGDKLESRALKCVMLGYPKGVKGYRLWCCEPGYQKVIFSRDVVFDESYMPFVKSENTDTSKHTVEVEVEGIVSDSGDTDIHETSGDLGGQTSSLLSSYQLARDRKRRVIHPPARFNDSELLVFAFTIAEQITHEEPKTYKEAINSKDKIKWLEAMEEEMLSLEKNNTWTLVDRP